MGVSLLQEGYKCLFIAHPYVHVRRMIVRSRRQERRHVSAAYMPKRRPRVPPPVVSHLLHLSGANRDRYMHSDSGSPYSTGKYGRA